MRTLPLALLLTVLLVYGIAACQRAGREAGTQEETAAETAPLTETPTTEQVTYQVVVNNPMPHAMNVVATLPDGGQIQLGTVPAGGESAFSLTGAPGASVTIVASDDANTHSPSGTVTLPLGETTVRWTIQ